MQHNYSAWDHNIMVGRSTLQKHPVFKWQWLGIYANCIVKPYGIVDRSNGDEAWQTSKDTQRCQLQIKFYYTLIHYSCICDQKV